MNSNGLMCEKNMSAKRKIKARINQVALHSYHNCSLINCTETVRRRLRKVDYSRMELSRNPKDDTKRALDVVVALGEIKKINSAITRYYNSKLTKKQKRSSQYSNQYWGGVQYLSCDNTIGHNQQIYTLTSLKQDRYEGQLDMNKVRLGYKSRDELLDSLTIAFGSLSVLVRGCVTRTIEVGHLSTFLFERMRQPFRLELSVSHGRNGDHAITKEMLSSLVNVKEIKISGYVLANWHTMENALDDLSIKIAVVELQNMSFCSHFRSGNTTWLETVSSCVPYPDSTVATDDTYSVVECSSTLD